MCGIVGLVHHNPQRQCSTETLTTMRDVLTYRGPDDSGLHVDGSAGLGFRRLSIIDLSGGHQPMSGPRPSQWIVFNGEIYNYQALRRELIQGGAQFQTQSDTEVILQLYAQRGERCVEALNGMFAFAIWDSEHRSLFLARDRMGVKPLYYADDQHSFVFASEVKALFESGVVKAEARPEALAEYMLFRQVAGHGFFRGVHAVPPGCTLTLKDGKTRTTRYWSPRPTGIRRDLSFAEATHEFATLFEDSVRLRLISDVPVGTFCSGGVDSSLVTAVAARLKGDAVNTFSVGFEEEAFDESVFAQEVSQAYRTKHHVLRVSHDEFNELLPQMIWHNDEPLDFANSVHIFALSRLAKQHVTVVLTGEGSDELFAGYPRYRVPGLSRKFRILPSALRGLLSSVSGDHRLAKLDRFASYTSDDALLYNSSYLRPDLIHRLAPMLPAFQSEHRAECLAAGRALGLDLAARASLLDQETFLVSILHRQDKMSMGASIESRVPFMDYRIVEFANSLPMEHKIRNGAGKALVKAHAETLLPKSVVFRRKSGFGVPLSEWFRADRGLGERVQALPSDPRADVFDRNVLQQLVTEHRSGRHDHSDALWAALNVTTWRHTFNC